MKTQISKFKLSDKASSSLKATANILIDEAIEIIGFTVIHNQKYGPPIINNPAVKKNGKYYGLIKIHDKVLEKEITELIEKKYYVEVKTKKQSGS